MKQIAQDHRVGRSLQSPKTAKLLALLQELSPFTHQYTCQQSDAQDSLKGGILLEARREIPAAL